jgi:chromatin remodeling complex protein RSC6
MKCNAHWYFKPERITVKKLLFMTLASLYALSASAASDKDTAAVVKDEQAGNAKDKAMVKKASPEAKQSAKDEARKTKAQPSSGESSTGSSAK